MSYKQLKLTSGEEFIANIIDVDQEEGVIVMAQALKIIESDNAEEGISYFAFRPLMSFTEDMDKIHILNLAHIVVETTPSENIMKHYNRTIEKMKRVAMGGKTMEELEEASEEEFEEYMKMLDDLDEYEEEIDPRGDNIVKFRRPKDTFH
jgi:hypothetical protein